MSMEGFTPVASGFSPNLNLHRPNETFDSEGLTTDGKLGWVIGKVKSISLRKKGEGKKARNLQILQIEVEDTNVKMADGVPVQKGKIYTLWGDGNLLSRMGLKFDEDGEIAEATLQAWADENGDKRAGIEYEGGKAMDAKFIKERGLKAGTRSHQYFFGFKAK